MQDCIFCKIIRENGIKKVYEDDWTVAFMDIAKDVDGHIIAIPKKHVKSILDCDSGTLGKLMDCVKKVSNHLVDNCGYDGVNLLNASNESAGQSVPHFHIHIIPRYKDGQPLFAYKPLEVSADEMSEIKNKIVE